MSEDSEELKPYYDSDDDSEGLEEYRPSDEDMSAAEDEDSEEEGRDQREKVWTRTASS